MTAGDLPQGGADETTVAESTIYRACLGAIVGWFAGFLIMLLLGWTVGYAFLGGEDVDESPMGELILMATVGAFAGTSLGAVAGAALALLRKREAVKGDSPTARPAWGSRLPVRHRP